MKMDKNMDVETSEKPVKKIKEPHDMVKKVKEPKEKEPKEKDTKKNGVDMKDLKSKIKEIERSQKQNEKSLQKINAIVSKMK